MSQPIWVTPAGSIGSYPAQVSLSPAFQFVATPVIPAITVTYKLISGSFPAGLFLATNGVLSGAPGLVTKDTTYSFVIRVTDDLGNIRDRTFFMIVSGVVTPEFTTPSGTIEIIPNEPSIYDSTWVEFPMQYSNPVSTNEVSIRVIQGQLPPGLEINDKGLIRGYAEPPTLNFPLGTVSTAAIATSSSDNTITALSISGFRIGRPIVFSGNVIGGLVSGQTYFVTSIIAQSTKFTVSNTSNGSVVILSDESGYMNITLPNISVGQPTVRTYPFTLQLDSEFGSDTENYSITVANQNAPLSEGGPNLLPNTRIPTIYNTRPATYNIEQDTTNFGYYVLPNDSGATYQPEQLAYIGKLTSDNKFSFKVLGYDFDGDNLTYEFDNIPPNLDLVGDSITGWITGTPIINDNNISNFSFSVRVKKTNNSAIVTPYFNFSFTLRNDIVGDIEWLTPENLGIIENGTLSVLSVLAKSDVELQYRILSGSLPPNLFLLSNGEITGTVAYQPTDTLLPLGAVTDFTFTIEAFYPLSPTVVNSTRTFTVTVLQQYTQPTDTLYIKCTPGIEDRNLIQDLLENTSLIPNDVLYRPQDPNFSKASSVTYVHAYGIYANDLAAYLDSVSKNHYWRNITLGEIKTAVARNDQGKVIYEVVYSSIIDDLINPQGISVAKEIVWPRPINLFPEGYARTLYPNSLPNMREQVGDELGQDFNYSLYPRWMTSQQNNGSTLGFTPAWVIAYCKPGFAEQVKSNIENNWKDPVGNNIRLNQINFKLDRFTVDKSATYNYDTELDPPEWTELPSATPVPNPKDENDFHVLYPRETILPDETQY